ncbi:MAG: hypothetical protein IPF59_14325 [Ignavibacteria bacterium]|nr:hypothetical protein [Ignavibacteria bacterium]
MMATLCPAAMFSVISRNAGSAIRILHGKPVQEIPTAWEGRSGRSSSRRTGALK